MLIHSSPGIGEPSEPAMQNIEQAMQPVEILDQRCVAPGFYLLALDVPDCFLDSVPGQFVMVRPENNESAFLPRPLSIHSVYRQYDRIFCEILYQVVGKGTRLLSQLQKGQRVVINGPLGQGFSLENLPSRIILIAGGIGIAPIRYLAEKISGMIEGEDEIICYQGARSADVLPDANEVKSVCTRFYISTDDGSVGQQGFVTDNFAADLFEYSDQDAVIYACGPQAMLRSLKGVLEGRDIPCQVSVEEKMACGVGACLGCAIRAASGGFKCVCKDGPVFDIDELDWENDD